jgi:hypothetical protein
MPGPSLQVNRRGGQVAGHRRATVVSLNLSIGVTELGVGE